MPGTPTCQTPVQPTVTPFGAGNDAERGSIAFGDLMDDALKLTADTVLLEIGAASVAPLLGNARHPGCILI